MSTSPESVFVHGQEAQWSHEEVDGKLVVSLKEDVSEVVVEVRV